MSWQTAKLAAETVCLLLVGASAVYVAHDLHETQVQAQAAIAELQKVESGVYGTLQTINHPCAPGPCGTLAEINKSAVKLQDITVVLQKQVAQSSTLVNAASQSITQVSAHLDSTADALTGTATAATGSLKALTDDERAVRPSIDALPPLLARSAGVATDLDALLKSKALAQTVAGLGTTAQNAGLISSDLYAFEHRILDPEPCKTRRCLLGRAAKDVPIVLGIGTEAMDLYNAFRGYPVNVKSLP